MAQSVSAFYVDVAEINSDGLTRVGLAAALPRIDDDEVTLQPGDRIFAVDADDNVASAVVVEQNAASFVIRVGHDWFPMSLADVEMRAIVGAVHAAGRPSPS